MKKRLLILIIMFGMLSGFVFACADPEVVVDESIGEFCSVEEIIENKLLHIMEIDNAVASGNNSFYRFDEDSNYRNILHDMPYYLHKKYGLKISKFDQKKLRNIKYYGKIQEFYIISYSYDGYDDGKEKTVEFIEDVERHYYGAELIIWYNHSEKVNREPRGVFYSSLQEAYNSGALTVEDLEKIAYVKNNNILSTQEMEKETELYLKACVAESFTEEYKKRGINNYAVPHGIRIDKYYGCFDNIYIVAIPIELFGYTSTSGRIVTKIIGGVAFRFVESYPWLSVWIYNE